MAMPALEFPVNDNAPHLLVIDDDKRIRTLLGRYLNENGFRVTTAADADDARRRLSGLAFDLLIVDVMMPGEDGLSLVKSFVELHEGQVSLISRLGRGTTVICRFPVDGPGARRVASA